MKTRLNNLDERFVLGEINKEKFEKFKLKYETEKKTLSHEIEEFAVMGSNLEIAIKRGLEIAENISQLWVSSSFSEKQQLQ